MRRTGRTGRIHNHILDRLFSGDIVLAHDHTDYKHTRQSHEMFLRGLIDKFNRQKELTGMTLDFSVDYISKEGSDIYYSTIKIVFNNKFNNK